MPHTLLLADDSVTIQRVIELTFADEDVTVVAVGDGDQAIERLESSPPDIVLADIGMPGKNGYEVAQYIRRSPKLEHIPVVLLTGAFEPVDQALADDAKCDGILAKPFEPQLVIGRVKELLGRPQRAADQAPTVKEAGPSFGEAPGETQANRTHADLNAYFDRLDTAFNPATSGAEADVKSSPASPPSELDWFSALGHNAETPQPDAPVRADAAADRPQYQPSSYADVPSAWQQTPEPASVDKTEPAHAAAQAVEPETIAGPASQAQAPHHDDVAAAHTVIAEPEASPAPIAESKPIESIPPPAVQTTRAVEPVRTAQVAPTPAVSPTARVLELPLKSPASVPPLADAFAALLAAEQGAPPVVSWPAPSSAAPVSDATIETITRRVLERLSDTVVRQTVSDIVSKIAERLVREEIERIKASIK